MAQLNPLENAANANVEAAIRAVLRNCVSGFCAEAKQS